MGVLRIILTILFILVCVALTVIVLMQEGKSQGLGAVSGATETYWSQNKGRSKEGLMVLVTRTLSIVFILLAIVLNLNVF